MPNRKGVILENQQAETTIFQVPPNFALVSIAHERTNKKKKVMEKGEK